MEAGIEPGQLDDLSPVSPRHLAQVRDLPREMGVARAAIRPVAWTNGTMAVPRRGVFAPTPRKRADRSLTLAEREEISRGISSGRLSGEFRRPMKG